MTKERPILFSTPMVEAILDGRKTQTRRTRGATFQNFEEFARIKCPYGKPGDRLWVRETWQITNFLHPSNENYGYVYKASENGKDWQENTEEWKWKPSIYMPKAAARIWLEVTDIRVERLQDISEEDAISEGIKTTWINDDSSCNKFKNYINNGKGSLSPKDSFRSLWESINGAESWDRNPWLWVIKFKVLSTTGKEAIQ